MLEQKDYFGSMLMGLGGTEPVNVRETNWGYVIRSANPGGSRRQLIDMIARFAIFVVWIAVIGIWLAPVGLAPEQAFVIKAFVSVALLGLTYCLIGLSRQLGGYEFQVDINRRELRTAILTGKGQSWIRASFRFDEISDTVLQRGRLDQSARSLCLRLKTGCKLIPVAIGSEATLLGVHDRLMHDLRPIEERMAAFGLQDSARSVKLRRAFRMLGPDEVAV